MDIKLKATGLVLSLSLLTAAGTSQACGRCATADPFCSPCTIMEGISGTGWGYVPCDAPIRPALTWQQYYSGGYTPPVVERRGGLFFWPF